MGEARIVVRSPEGCSDEDEDADEEDDELDSGLLATFSSSFFCGCSGVFCSTEGDSELSCDGLSSFDSARSFSTASGDVSSPSSAMTAATDPTLTAFAPSGICAAH